VKDPRPQLLQLKNLQHPRNSLLSPSTHSDHDLFPILDLRARDRKGGYYHVEVQLKGTDLDYTKRSLYYTTRLYSDQLKSGHDYHLLERSVSISLLDFILFPEGQELHSTFSLWDRAQDFQLTRDLELHYIELPKFTPERKGREETSLEVARRMLARGADRAFILEVTELSEQELVDLEKEQVTRES